MFTAFFGLFSCTCNVFRNCKLSELGKADLMYVLLYSVNGTKKNLLSRLKKIKPSVKGTVTAPVR